MKAKLFTVFALVLFPITPAVANDQGAWVKVDAQGNAISGPIVCTSDVCGNPSSLYNQMTLGAGERYVLQFAADPVTKNVAGIGNNTPGVDVKVNLDTNEWTTSEIKTIVLPNHKSYQEQVITKWQSGNFESHRQTTVTPLTIKQAETSQTFMFGWDYLSLLSFDELVKLFMQLLNGVNLR